MPLDISVDNEELDLQNAIINAVVQLVLWFQYSSEQLEQLIERGLEQV